MKKLLIRLFILSFICISVLSAGSVTAQAKTKKTLNVLMIGNSLTSCNGNTTMVHLKKMAGEIGYKLNLNYVAYGGERLETYANERNARGKAAARKIASKKWDIVVLQQETDSAFKRGRSLKTAVMTLAKKIGKKSPKAKIVLNCTWGYDFKKSNLTHSQQQARMDSNYKYAAKAIDAEVAYTGDAFDSYKKWGGTKTLYSIRKWNHASEAGWYLNALSLFSRIFEIPATDLSYNGKVGKAQAKLMKTVATSKDVIKKREAEIEAAKEEQDVQITTRNIKVSKSRINQKDKKIKAEQWITIKKARGDISYEVKSSDSRKISVNRKGTILIKQGLKKGTYIVRIRVRASGNNKYRRYKKIAKVKVTVE